VWPGGETKLEWGVRNEGDIAGGISCAGSASPSQTDWSGALPSHEGNRLVSPVGGGVNGSGIVTYTILCTTSGGTESADVTVTIFFLREIIPSFLESPARFFSQIGVINIFGVGI